MRSATAMFRTASSLHVDGGGARAQAADAAMGR